MSKLHNIEGQRFGQWTVGSQAANAPNGQTQWHCRCECGTERPVLAASLTHGKSQNCGRCGRRGKIGDWARTHGKSQTPEYRTWAAMKARCFRTTNSAHHNYGARGITVCARWLHDFSAFLADMGPRPSANHTIERRDNDGSYSPENCIWLPASEQQHNTRRSHRLTFNGQTYTVTQWCQRLGLTVTVLHSRLTKYGWSIERALTEPVGPQGKRGETKATMAAHRTGSEK